MTEVIVKIKPLIDNFTMPLQATPGSAGFDCYYQGEEDILIIANSWKLIPLGFSMEIAPGYEAQIRPRSGLAKNHGVTILNSPATLDADYRGPVGAILINHAFHSGYMVKPMDRICQIVIAPVPKVQLERVDSLSDTERGSGGFGSTGV